MNKASTSSCIVQTQEIAKVVLMPGDPLRAKYVAENYLENPVCFNTVRNMLGFTGTYKGRKISVMGSGMGIPSMTLYATELFTQFDVDTIIRMGSTGALPDDIHLNDVIIAEAASTDSAFADAFDFPGRLTPCATYKVLQHAVDSAKELGIETKVGPIFCSDHFYLPDKKAAEKLRDFGIMAIEMETAGLYWVAAENRKQALSILTVTDHLFSGEMMTSEQRQNSLNNMMKVALETAWRTLD